VKFRRNRATGFAAARKIAHSPHIVGKPVRFIRSRNLCAGNVFLQPVRKLAAETYPQVSAPPENSEEFQARAAFLLCVEKPTWFFNASKKYAYFS
jgi:hypothetical protein